MKKTKTAGIVVLLCGLGLFLVSMFADYIGVGDVDPDHFTVGYKQIAGMLVGAAVGIAGTILWRKK